MGSLSEQLNFLGRNGHPIQNVKSVIHVGMHCTHDAQVFKNALTAPAVNFPYPPPLLPFKFKLLGGKNFWGMKE